MEKIHITRHPKTSHIYGSIKRQKKDQTTESILIMRNIQHGWKIGENSNSHNFSFSKQYERLTENERIAKRISNPKRDRWIQQSFKRTMKSFSSQEKAKKRSRKKLSNTTFQGWKIERIPTVRESQEDYELKIQNERMGKRIINMKPKIISFHSRNQSKPNLQNSKINQGVKAFFNTKSFLKENQKQNACNSLLKSYGLGSTIISLRHIKIQVHPPLKEEDYVYFELLVRNTNRKLYTTQLMDYKRVVQNNLKFSVRMSKLGDSVPLRIWKSQGLDNVELGIVDIQLSQYFYQQDRISHAPFQKMSNFQQWPSLEDHPQAKSKPFIKKEVSKKMRKSKIEECQSRISFSYLENDSKNKSMMAQIIANSLISQAHNKSNYQTCPFYIRIHLFVTVRSKLGQFSPHLCSLSSVCVAMTTALAYFVMHLQQYKLHLNYQFHQTRHLPNPQMFWFLALFLTRVTYFLLYPLGCIVKHLDINSNSHRKGTAVQEILTLCVVNYVIYEILNSLLSQSWICFCILILQIAGAQYLRKSGILGNFMNNFMARTLASPKSQ